MQLGRSLFTRWALAGRSPGNVRNFQRISAWLSLSALFWLPARQSLSARASGCGPSRLSSRRPPGGRSLDAGPGSVDDPAWDVEGGHLPERGLFVIIALG
jgi:low temperature requirement protein LtrA